MTVISVHSPDFIFNKLPRLYHPFFSLYIYIYFPFRCFSSDVLSRMTKFQKSGLKFCFRRIFWENLRNGLPLPEIFTSTVLCRSLSNLWVTKYWRIPKYSYKVI